ncbi:putative membrane protein [Microcystis aeruginosa TAIHU98]|uniref:Putative membrane protein n=1 Tax=Microcystis aeruginosa TAIHU98 TaxID=1134457 RepID=L7E3X6_MICAE|nr:putative membrane protein [Microcystis aeruginosa TAIHU98]
MYLQPRQWCPFFGFIYFKNYLFICIFLNLYKIDLSFVKSS